jgi:putative phosphoribosyl transferase
VKSAGSDPNDFRGATYAGALPWLHAPRFRNREEAGRELAEALADYNDRSDVIVLALPRGGVPVGAEVAHALGVPLDLMLVRKLGVPGHEELAMGAIASGGIRVLNEDVVGALEFDEAAIRAAERGERQELERRDEAYRHGRPPVALADRTVILVDDGLATGATMRAAVAALKRQQAERIVVAVPVAPPQTCEVLRGEADEVVCLAAPDPFMAIGVWYEDFPQLTDEEVRELLEGAWGRVEAR